MDSLQNIVKHNKPEEIRGTLVFAITENRVSYYILHSGNSKVMDLYFLAMRIVLLTTLYGITLIVIWVPGELMIEEGSEGLSRVLWISYSQTLFLSTENIAAMFN